MAPTATLPDGNPPVRANRPPEKGKPAPSAKSIWEADAQSPERKRKIPPSADPPETNKKKKKKKKTRSPSAETKKKTHPLKHAWTPGDEVRILEVMAAYRQDKQGKLPGSKVLFASLNGRLDGKGVGLQKLRRKVRSLKRQHDDDAIKGRVPVEEHEYRIYRLSKNVWDIIPEPVASSGGAIAPNVCRPFDEMRQLYPCLTPEVVHIVHEPAVLEKLLLGIDENKARALNSKIKDLREELTEAITDSAKMQNIEVPKRWQCPYNKLQPAMSRAANESILYLQRVEEVLDIGDGAQEKWARMNRKLVKLRQEFLLDFTQEKLARMNRKLYLQRVDEILDITQEKLARMNRKLVKLRQGIIAFGLSPKAESAESAPRLVVAEKQFSHNVMPRKTVAQQKLACGNNKEVTSKYRPPKNLSRKMILAPQRMHLARKENMDAKSQILHDVNQGKVAGCAQQGLSHHINVEGGKQVILSSYVRPHLPVAKATLQTCSPSTIVGGKALGTEFCQVSVNEVLVREAPLIRPFGTMMTMADALGYSIAWIREKTQYDTAADVVAPNQPSPGEG